MLGCKTTVKVQTLVSLRQNWYNKKADLVSLQVRSKNNPKQPHSYNEYALFSFYKNKQNKKNYCLEIQVYKK